MTGLAGVDETLDRAPCGFVRFGADGTVLAVNATLLSLLGYAREDVVGQRIEQLFAVGTRIFYQTHWFPLLRLHGHAEEVFLMLRSRGGEDIGVLSYAQRNAGVERETAYDCVLVRVQERAKYEAELLRARRVAEESNARLEEQKRELMQVNDQLEEQAVEMEQQQQQLQEQTYQLEAAAEEMSVINSVLQARSEEAEQLRVLADSANQAKSEFLAKMSHELRTPLNAINGYLEILELGIPGTLNKGQLDIVNRIHQSSGHLLRLINELLNLARIESGRMEYNIRPAPAAEIVGDIMVMMESQFANRSVRFTVDVPPSLMVCADIDKAQQIILNLLSNSLKFTPANGAVELRGSYDAAAERVCLEVRDTGIGIPEDRLDSIFEPFVQVKSGNHLAVEGTGLGLAISRELARGMGGDLSAKSTIGGGSTFTLTLRAK